MVKAIAVLVVGIIAVTLVITYLYNYDLEHKGKPHNYL